VYDNSAGRLTMSAFAITGLTLMVRPSANDEAYSAETFDPMLKVSIHPNMSGNANHHSVQSNTSHQTNLQSTMFHNPTGISQLRRLGAHAYLGIVSCVGALRYVRGKARTVRSPLT